MAILQAGGNGKAPSNAKVGDTIKTAGGNFKITGGTSGNWTSQRDTPSTPSKPSTTTPSKSNGSKSSGSKSGGVGISGSPAITPIAKPNAPVSGNISSGVVKVGSNGKAPSGLTAGTKIQTAGGQYEIVGVNPDGSYKSKKTTVPQPSWVDPEVSTPATYTRNGLEMKGTRRNGQTFDEAGNRLMPGDITMAGGGKFMMGTDGKGIDIRNAHETGIYKDEDGLLKNQGRNAYVVDGKSYDSATGGRIAKDNIIKAQNGTYYKMGDTKGEIYKPTALQTFATEPVTELPVKDATQQFIDMLMQQGIVQAPELGKTLSLEEALARATGNLNPQYNQAMENSMDQLDEKALRSGFYGQLPTEALKRQTAGKLEVDKLNAIQELASKLFGQSEDSAYKALDAGTQKQQTKLNTLLQMLGIYNDYNQYTDSRTDADWEKKMAEDKFGLAKTQAAKSGSGSGSSKSATVPTMTKDEAYAADYMLAQEGKLSPQSLKDNQQKLMGTYGEAKYKKLLLIAEGDAKNKIPGTYKAPPTTKQGMSNNWWER